ncbi:26976_t:CDS:1, partial [Racocetra persica]
FVNSDQPDDSIEYTATGTPAYIPYEIAKELINNKKSCHYTCAVDMWSFGVLNYHALTGNMPFMGEDAQEDLVFEKIVKEEINYSPLQELNLQCAIEFISGLCCKDPKSRLTAHEAMKH